MRLFRGARFLFALSWPSTLLRLVKAGWPTLRCLLAMAPAFVFGGCSLLVAKHGTRPIRSLSTRSLRADVVAELGAPHHSVTFPTPVEAPAIMFPPAGKATRRDEFEISGLRLAPGDTIGSQSQWDWYPLGTNEFTTLPRTVREWGQRARQRDRLRVWYDPLGRVLTWEVKSERYPEEPERPFGWAVRSPVR